MANQQANPQSFTYFEDKPVLGWVVDSFEQLDEALLEQAPNFDLLNYIENYKRDTYDSKIEPLFTDAPLKLNLGGETDKSKIVPTDKSNGIFDFSMALRGMYKIPEYFSQLLADTFPNKFKEFDLESGVVPPNLVQEKDENGEKIFYYQDSDGYFQCEIRDGGFATRNKKVYLTYKKNKGKVKYVEIYSLFYYDRMSGDLQYAIRHFPALMLAEYLESIGIMTRVYMTRFVLLNKSQLPYTLKKEYNGIQLPLYTEAQPITSFEESLFILPIIVKEFGQSFDKALGFMTSSRYFNYLYETLATWSLKKEVKPYRGREENYYVYGDPNWSQVQYYTGIERYRKKYEEYVKLGIFKSKEVLPQSMVFFHDLGLNIYLGEFLESSRAYVRDVTKAQSRPTETEALMDIKVNEIFNWWMKLSSMHIKNKIDLYNSKELQKDLSLMEIELKTHIDNGKLIINTIDNNSGHGMTYMGQMKRLFVNLMKSYNIFPTTVLNYDDSDAKVNFMIYIIGITNEITTYASDKFFATEEEVKEERNDFVDKIFENIS